MTRRIKIIAIGNPLMGDDGVGPAVIERMREMELPANVTLVNSGADPLDATVHLLDADKAIIIDAAAMNRAPGHIEMLSPENLQAREADDRAPCSTHIYGLTEGLQLAKAVGFDPEIRIIGVQPLSTAPSEGLSPEVSSCIPDVINLVLEEVAT